MDKNNVTLFYKLNRQSGEFEFSHVEDGWKVSPESLKFKHWSQSDYAVSWGILDDNYEVTLVAQAMH